MFGTPSMRSQLEEMEHAAEESLCNDAAFYEVLQALKWEIDADPQVQSIVTNMKVTGSTVFISFVPHINILVKAADRNFSLARRKKGVPSPDENPLTRALHAAACDVIRKSGCVSQLNALAIEVLDAHQGCRRILRELRRAEYKVVVSVGISSYAQIRPRLEQPAYAPDRNEAEGGGQERSSLPLSNQDAVFLRTMGISVDGNQTRRS